MPDHHPDLAHQFEDMDQQRETATLGMWAFLITEVLFFGGLFTVYVMYRYQYPVAFVEGSHRRPGQDLLLFRLFRIKFKQRLLW